MDIRLTDSSIRKFLKTEATPQVLADMLSLSGPTVDKLEQVPNDWIYHIEIITNRADSASAFGVAREAYAILTQNGIQAELIHSPYENTSALLGNIPGTAPVSVTIADPTLVPRFSCIAIGNVHVSQSPQHVCDTLEHCGQRGINALVDITNELTIEYGQPVHIFDLDTISKKSMTLRKSKKGETITTLDGQTHILPGGDIVIEDGSGALIDLCGIMGGENSRVTEKTKNVLLFVQQYEPKHIRKTSLALQKRTLAAQLFEKRLDAQLVMPVLIAGVQRILERAGGTVVSSLVDIYPNPYSPKTITLECDWLNRFSGITLKTETSSSILKSLGFSVETKGNALVCTVPSWREWDCRIREDIAEEILRIYGYANLPSILPITGVVAGNEHSVLKKESVLRNLCVRLGYTELYTSSLISRDASLLSNIPVSKAVTLVNPLSDEYTHLRTSLLPMLTRAIGENIHRTSFPIQLFECGHIYTNTKTHSQPASEHMTIAFAVNRSSYEALRGDIEYILRAFHIPFAITEGDNQSHAFLPGYYGTIRSGDRVLGQIGKPSASLAQFAGVSNEDIWIGQLDADILLENGNCSYIFTPIPATQAIIEDLTFTLPDKTPIGTVIDALRKHSGDISDIFVKDIFNNNYTLTFQYRSSQKNLSSSDIAPLRIAILKKVKDQFGGSLVGTLPEAA